MTKSKRKRKSYAVRTIPLEELGPNFFKRFKTETIHRLKNELGFTFQTIDKVHELIGNPKQPTEKNQNTQEIEFSNKAHIHLVRSALIEGMVILDSYIGLALNQYQVRILKRKPQEVSDYSKMEDGLDDCLKNENLPKEFERKRTKIKHYRALRNQFAHYKAGSFMFSAKYESFESFLKELKGIELKDSLWVVIDGKAGVCIPYHITSNTFLEQFYKDCEAFLNELLNMLFPE